MKTPIRVVFAALLAGSLFLPACSSSSTVPEVKKVEPETSVTNTPPTPPPAPVEKPAEKPADTPKPRPSTPAKAKATPAAPPAPPQQQVSNAPAPQPTFLPGPAPVPVPEPTSPGPIAVPEPVARHFTIPSGTLIGIRMIDAVDSKTGHVGQTFHASLDAPITVDNQVVGAKGADVYVKLTEVQSAGNLKGQSELKLQLDRILIEKKAYSVESNVFQTVGAAQGAKTAKAVGIGTAIGAAIGAIAGGKKGAIIGAGTGAGAGVGIEAATKGEQVRVESESRLDFRLERPLEVTLRYVP